MKLAVVAVTVSGLAVVAAPASGVDPVLKLAGDGKYHERFESKTPVSGGTVLGVQVNLDNTSLDPRKLSVYAVPASSPDDVLCVQVTTSSGHYWSLNGYALANSKGWANLYTQSEYVQALEDFKAPAFAVRAELKKLGDTATAGAPCATSGKGEAMLFIAGLGNPARPPSPITILLNSKRTPASVELLGADGKVKAKAACERIRNLATRAYDARCDLTLPEPASGRHRLVVKLAEPGEEPEIQRLTLVVP